MRANSMKSATVAVGLSEMFSVSRRFSAYFLVLLASFWMTSKLHGQNDQRLYPVRWSSPALEREARAHSEVLWRTILTKCDGFYYYAGSGLDNLGWADNAMPFRTIGVSGANIVKYSGDVQFQVFAPMPTANVLPSPDGLEDVGYAVMYATTFQTGSIEQKVWSNPMTVPRVDLRPDSRMTPAVIQAVYQNGLFGGVVGTSGNIVIHMQRKNGRWYYTIVGILTKTMREEEALMDSDDGLPGKPPHPRVAIGRDLSGSGHMFLYKSYGAPIQRINCDTMIDPSVKDKAERETRQQGLEKRLADAHATKSADGYIFPSLAMLRAVPYTGSVAEFSKVLPDLVKASFSSDGSGALIDYGPEIEFILRQVQICATIDERTKPYVYSQDNQFKACSYRNDPFSLKYVDAVSGESVNSERQPAKPRDLLVTLSPDYNESWGVKPFVVSVYVRGLESDPPTVGWNDRIVRAHLHR